MTKDKKKLEETLKKIYAAALLTKYAGYAALAVSLTGIVLSSLLHAFQWMPWFQNGVLLGILLIIISLIAERLLAA